MANFRDRRDLVISMTLAETFLLLVFMLWYSIRPKVPAMPPSSIEVVTAENKRLKDEIAGLREKLADLDRRLEWWRTRFNQPVPGSEQELKQILFEAGRGKPKCQDDNTLLEVRLIDGVASVKVLADSPALKAALIGKHIDFSVGSSVASQADVDAVLAEARRFRKGPGAEGDCRFDYQFVYSTNDDYYEGRERFEKYFYSAGRRRVTQAAR
jgi:hypothetical protein